ncbi:unnamed protein product [Didymodactylos carnosus]|uniref:Uncharacterized protein n=1 Tax=Didymodactylos carnosus TaxID=1234261 RepID=A0A813W424_9BILA|nr:unnamed protein product [Didymodactylos carnosus]CAF3640003.1 unnamed protein product [Didymodactylos carnosus]
MVYLSWDRCRDLSNVLESAFRESERFITDRLSFLNRENDLINGRFENEQQLMKRNQQKMDTLLSSIVDNHHQTSELQAALNSTYNQLYTRANQRIQIVDNMYQKLLAYEQNLMQTSPSGVNLKQELNNENYDDQFSNNLQRAQDLLKNALRIGSESNKHTQVLYGSFDSELHSKIKQLYKHDRNEKEQYSSLQVYKEELKQDIMTIHQNTQKLNDFIRTLSPILEHYTHDEP